MTMPAPERAGESQTEIQSEPERGRKRERESKRAIESHREQEIEHLWLSMALSGSLWLPSWMVQLLVAWVTVTWMIFPRRVASVPTMSTCFEGQRRLGRPSSPGGKPFLLTSSLLLKLVICFNYRKGFDVTMWRPLCSCKHPHAVHDPVKDRTRCRECNCSK